jgi:hypothetical protein
MAELAKQIPGFLSRQVLDMTAPTGTYEIDLICTVGGANRQLFTDLLAHTCPRHPERLDLGPESRKNDVKVW